MSKALFLFVAGVFIGAVIIELNRRSNTKWQFTRLFENLMVKEADDAFVGAVAKNEGQFMDDLHR